MILYLLIEMEKFALFVIGREPQEIKVLKTAEKISHYEMFNSVSHYNQKAILGPSVQIHCLVARKYCI